MKIDIHPVRLELSDPFRTYAEYRMFSAVGRFDGDGVRLDVLVEDCGVKAEARYRCIAGVDLQPAGRVWVTAVADQLYAVIDRAAERLSKRVESERAGKTGMASSPYPTAESEQRS